MTRRGWLDGIIGLVGLWWARRQCSPAPIASEPLAMPYASSSCTFAALPGIQHPEFVYGFELMSPEYRLAHWRGSKT